MIILLYNINTECQLLFNLSYARPFPNYTGLIFEAISKGVYTALALVKYIIFL